MRPWLTRIGVHLYYDHLRKRGRGARVVALDPLAFEPEGGELEPLEAMAGREAQALLAEAIGRLPERLQVVLVMRVVEGREYDEVAKVVGLKPATVRTQVSQGRKLLMRLLDPWLRGNRRKIMMGCGQAKRFLRAEFAGDLTLEQRMNLEAHLEGCSACKGRARAQGGVLDRLSVYRESGGVERVDLDRFVGGVLGRIGDDGLETPPAERPWMRWAPLAGRGFGFGPRGLVVAGRGSSGGRCQRACGANAGCAEH